LDLSLRIDGMTDEQFKELDYANTIIKEQSPKPRYCGGARGEY